MYIHVGAHCINYKDGLIFLLLNDTLKTIAFLFNYQPVLLGAKTLHALMFVNKYTCSSYFVVLGFVQSL